jgi:hypothetical protein
VREVPGYTRKKAIRLALDWAHRFGEPYVVYRRRTREDRVLTDHLYRLDRWYFGAADTVLRQQRGWTPYARNLHSIDPKKRVVRPLTRRSA